MVDIRYVRPGNWLTAKVGGEHKAIVVKHIEEGKVETEVSEDEKWFSAEELFPILLDENWLKFLNFQQVESEPGSLKYERGPFTLTYPDKNNKLHVKLETMGEYPRNVEGEVSVHVIQNHYDDMIKMPMPV